MVEDGGALAGSLACYLDGRSMMADVPVICGCGRMFVMAKRNARQEHRLDWNAFSNSLER
jgi:hypothetical protein